LSYRLSEDPQVTVGVIEAGQLIDKEPLINVPGNVALSLGNTKYDWSFATTPQAGGANRSIPVPRFDASSPNAHVVTEAKSACLEENY
jgi:choline dehydrogenase-like flavoprotein